MKALVFQRRYRGLIWRRRGFAKQGPSVALRYWSSVEFVEHCPRVFQVGGVEGLENQL